MPTTAKKSATKTSARINGAATKSHAATHPTWVDMIKECIVDHPGDARTGVSRPMIKKFVENKYHIDLNPSTASQLNRAITSGSEKGIFLLPKGPSGKVKLAPKSLPDASHATKENTRPVVKKPATAKSVIAKPKIPATKTSAKKSVARVTARAPKTKAFTTTKVKTAKPATTPSKKFTTKTTKKATTARKSVTTKKTTTAKRGAAKKAVIGETKKPVSKPKSSSKAKPVSKTAKPMSRTKLASKTAT